MAYVQGKEQCGMPHIQKRNEIDLGQAILPGIIKKWLNGLYNLQTLRQLLPYTPFHLQSM